MTSGLISTNSDNEAKPLVRTIRQLPEHIGSNAVPAHGLAKTAMSPLFQCRCSSGAGKSNLTRNYGNTRQIVIGTLLSRQ